MDFHTVCHQKKERNLKRKYVNYKYLFCFFHRHLTQHTCVCLCGSEWESLSETGRETDLSPSNWTWWDLTHTESHLKCENIYLCTDSYSLYLLKPPPLASAAKHADDGSGMRVCARNVHTPARGHQILVVSRLPARAFTENLDVHIFDKNQKFFFLFIYFVVQSKYVSYHRKGRIWRKLFKTSDKERFFNDSKLLMK